MKTKSTLVYLLLLWIQTAGQAQPANINVSNSIFFEGEPFMAVNPQNPQNIVIAWMGLTFVGGIKITIKSKASFDGGQTWGSYHLQPHFSTTWGSADVSMAFRKDGELYLSYIDYRENPDSGGVYITRSLNGGIDWTAPVEVWNIQQDDPAKRPLDRPWLVVDNSNTDHFGTLYMTTKPAPWVPAPNRPYLKVSIDDGDTWSPYRYVDTVGYLVGNLIQAPMAAPAVTADGNLCIAYPSYLPAQSFFAKMLFAKSNSQGAGFQYYDLLVNALFNPDPDYKKGYWLAANPANADQLAFAYIGGVQGDPDINLSVSNNGGSSWSSPIRINDDPDTIAKSQDLVWVNYAANGDLLLTWRDRRNGTGSGFYQPSDTYAAVSRDNGMTFEPNLRLSNATAPFDSVLLENGNDFMSCQLVNDTIFAAWGDARSGKLNIYFTKTSATTGQSTGVVQVASDDQAPLWVYPNPANSEVTIQLPYPVAGLKLRITDASGRLFFEKENCQNQEIVHCQAFPAGIYSVQIYQKNELLGCRPLLISR